jgi:phosphatidylglycerol:prolipoprotein diacylglycerol transferase
LSFTPVPFIHLAGLQIPTHGFFFLLAAGLCLTLLSRQLSTQEYRRLLNSIPWLVLGSLTGARIAYLASRSNLWAEPSVWFRFWEGGMVSYGGMAGCFLVLWIRHGRSEEAAFFDRLAGPCLLAWGIGRIGCLLNWYGEAGIPTDVPWAFVVDGVARHPVTGYLSLLYIVGGLVLTAIGRSVPRGTAGAAVFYYALARSLCEPWREYHPSHLRELSLAMCAILAIFGLILFRRMGRVPATSVETFS